jgi:hypothetical protein
MRRESRDQQYPHIFVKHNSNMLRSRTSLAVFPLDSLTFYCLNCKSVASNLNSDYQKNRKPPLCHVSASGRHISTSHVSTPSLVARARPLHKPEFGHFRFCKSYHRKERIFLYRRMADPQSPASAIVEAESKAESSNASNTAESTSGNDKQYYLRCSERV